MRFFEDSGLIVQNGCTIAIDSSKTPKSDFAIISHAHSDHVFARKNFEGKVLASKETAELLNGRLPKESIQGVEFSKKQKLGSFEVSLEHAGHILGSSQIVLEGEKKVVITADFQMQEGLLFPKAEVQKADVLLIETTFGKPCFNFPAREQTVEEIAGWVKKNTKEGKFSLLAGYSLGKAQELCRIVSEFAGETPLVHEKAFEFNKIYESLGVNLGNFEKLGGNEKLKDFNAAILPPSMMGKGIVQALELSLGKKVCSAVATGWGFYGKSFDKVFPLSDHADFRQLVEYVLESGAKRVITMHGFEAEFARHLSRKYGINATPLSASSQKSIQEFLD